MKVAEAQKTVGGSRRKQKIHVFRRKHGGSRRKHGGSTYQVTPQTPRRAYARVWRASARSTNRANLEK